MAVKLNEKWHDSHKMPAHATVEQRMKWHAEHTKNCGCRPIPAKLLAQAKKKKAM